MAAGRRGAADLGGPLLGQGATELFQTFPHEAVRVLQRSVEVSAALTCLLGAHCLIVAREASHGIVNHPDVVADLVDPWELELPDVDRLVFSLCILRVLCMVPRPYGWLRERRRFLEARYLATPQEIVERLSQMESHSSFEEIKRVFYYMWLASMSAVVGVARIACEPSALVEQAWLHLIFNFVCMAVHRGACIALFFCLTSSRMQRGISADVLDAHSKRVKYAEVPKRWRDRPTSEGKETDEEVDEDEDGCSICLCDYTIGEDVRQLPCMHRFHCRCIDTWLVEHRNRCPICSDAVGVGLQRCSYAGRPGA